MTLQFSQKIEVRKSSIHGWGVFAREPIQAGEILEESPFLPLPMKNGESSSLLIDYRFNFPSGSGKKWVQQVVGFGFASLYNHSDTPNAEWSSDASRMVFIFRCTTDIAKDEEIFVYYGGQNYWEDGRKHTQVKISD
jgi:SET domain-containing protein